MALYVDTNGYPAVVTMVRNRHRKRQVKGRIRGLQHRANFSRAFNKYEKWHLTAFSNSFITLR